jgi:cell division protein FtsB
MDAQNLLIGLQIVLQLTEQIQRLAAVLAKAAQENRDITEYELKSLRQEDNSARRKLQDLIDQL